MPNWCSNTIKISGTTEQIDAFEKFLNEKNGKNWFDFFVKSNEGEDWYSYNIENYGCKWNCDAQDWNRDENIIEFWFDSPWSPPIRLYEKIQETDMVVYAEYLEEGMGFVGEFIDGVDETYEFSEENDLDEIPKHLVENWNLRDQFDDWDDNDDEFEEDDENGKSNS